MQAKTLLGAVLLFLSSSVMADVPLTQADLLGTWQIDKESVNSDGSNARGMNTTWEFRADGTMEGITEDKDANARVNQMRAILNYSVENGKLVKQAASGRSKMETCGAVEKDGSKLVLKCPSVYFFMTKK
jgi:hypothetical protein